MGCHIGLHNPKNSINVGSVLRSVHCFGGLSVLIQGRRYKKSITDVNRAWRYVPVIHVNNLIESIPAHHVPIAVELTDEAIDINNFTHPQNAFYIFGPEESGLGKKITHSCKETIYINTQTSLNLAMAVTAVMMHRQTQLYDSTN